MYHAEPATFSLRQGKNLALRTAWLPENHHRRYRRKSGQAKNLLYYYFKDKDAILVEFALHEIRDHYLLIREKKSILASLSFSWVYHRSRSCEKEWSSGISITLFLLGVNYEAVS